MQAADGILAAARNPMGAGYDVILILHILFALISFGAVVASAVAAARLRATPEGAKPTEAVANYFAPGVNWAGRTLFLVPVFGFILLPMSHGAYGIDDVWVQVGLALWLAVAVGGEIFLWPAERQVQAELVAIDTDHAEPERLAAACRGVLYGASTGAALLIAAAVVMFAKP